MIPILKPADVKAIDERALRHETLDEILNRVGAVVAAQAIEMLPDPTNARVIVLAGPGLNGADARVTAEKLADHGVSVDLLDALALPAKIAQCDLIIDGAFGIGLSRPWSAPDVGAAAVLAIDIPSGIDGLSGEALGSPLKATRTITLGGYKAGLLLGDGPDYCGQVVVGDIGLPGNDVRSRLIERSDLARWLPRRPRTHHKWDNALLIAAGSPGMTGAARLASGAAMRTGSGYVHLMTLADPDPGLASEVVSSHAFSDPAPQYTRFKAAIIGPGLSTTAPATSLVNEILVHFDGPVVIDGDGLTALVDTPDLLAGRRQPAVLTPHDGEYRRLLGHAPDQDRLGAAQRLAQALHCVVVLKGPATVIANSEGGVRVSNSGDQRLATAGTGDVLAGIIGALLAQGVDPFDAASAGAYLHGATGALGHSVGLIASDLVPLIPLAYESLTSP